MKAIHAEIQPLKHDECIEWVNRLVIDLRLRLGGEEMFTPITAERLNEWTHGHRPKLEQCRERRELKQ